MNTLQLVERISNILSRPLNQNNVGRPISSKRRCGFAVGEWTQDHGGVDGTIGAAGTVGSGHLARPKIDLQLKATCRNDVERAEYASWSLEMEHYDVLRARAHAPHLLVVLLLGADVDESVKHTGSPEARPGARVPAKPGLVARRG